MRASLDLKFYVILQNTLCRPWITVTPTYGMLIPGEQTEIEFTIGIDNVTSHLLNTSKEVLEDVLILRLENGRDYYISVKGSYARSCFGMSVEELVLYSDPIREVPLDPILRAERYDFNSKPAMCVPKELWRIIDAIYERGVNERDLFSHPGNPDEVYQIRECLDTGAAFENFSVHSMGETLTSFLSNLSTPIVSASLIPTLDIDAQNIQSFARKFLEDLPPIQYNVFIYIVSFFREVLLHRERNKLSPAKIARICCNCLVSSSASLDESAGSVHQRKGNMQQLMLHFLETNSI